VNRLALLLVIAALLAVACSSNDKPSGATASAESGVTTLFALQGQATFDGDRLVVQSAHVDWFTDRPERHAGRITGEAFVAAWDDGRFDEVPPNAFLTGDVSDTTVVLTEPQATANELSFRVKETLSGDTGTGDLGSIGLFIDSTSQMWNFGAIDGTIGGIETRTAELTPTPTPPAP
jgi:hypothetical protein